MHCHINEIALPVQTKNQFRVPPRLQPTQKGRKVLPLSSSSTSTSNDGTEATVPHAGNCKTTGPYHQFSTHSIVGKTSPHPEIDPYFIHPGRRRRTWKISGGEGETSAATSYRWTDEHNYAVRRRRSREGKSS